MNLLSSRETVFSFPKQKYPDQEENSVICLEKCAALVSFIANANTLLVLLGWQFSLVESKWTKNKAHNRAWQIYFTGKETNELALH